MSRADDYDYDDRPRRRRRDDDDDDYDDRPRRRARSSGGGGGGGVLVILGAIAGVLLLGCVICGGVMFFMAGPKVREAAARVQDTNSLKQIGLAAGNYQDAMGLHPPADGPVSWRVHLLPQLEQHALYRRFDVKQPWDVAQNRPLAGERVEPYHSALDDPKTVDTRFRVFVGPDTPFRPGGKVLRLTEITDGLSNTIFAAEAADAVPWPAPRELPYTKDGPLPKLGHPNRTGGFLVVMLDGSVKFVRSSVPEGTIRAGITVKDAVPVDFD